MSAEATRTESKKVVVIDDNVDAANSLADLLRLLGYEVQVAYDGRSGIACARQLRPQLVISDISMPGLSGYDVARELSSSDDTRSTFRVALTGFGETHTKLKAFEAGFHEHLTKPLEMSKLLTILSGARL